jgi:hypothetical protein
MFSEWGTRNALSLPLFVSALVCDHCGYLRPSSFGELAERLPERGMRWKQSVATCVPHAERGNEISQGVRRLAQ